MREIKFRAWDTSINSMNYRVLCGNTKTDDPCSSVYLEDRRDWVNFDKFSGVIMQFTGLHDKNGKEIYEGDILWGYFNINDVEDYLFIRLTDKEKEDGRKIFVVDNIHFGYDVPIPEILEVIGNIYENPELLEEQK